MKKILIAIFLTTSIFGASASAKDFTGSISLSIFKDETSAIDQVKINIEKAVKIARSETGGTQVMRAELERSYGYLVWEISLVGNNRTVHQIVIDPANGKILYQESWRK